MAWYEVMRKDTKMPFVVGEIEKHSYLEDIYTIRPLYPLMPEGSYQLSSANPNDQDALASVIDPNEWNEDLDEEDRDFARESAEQVLEKFHVFRKG